MTCVLWRLVRRDGLLYSCVKFVLLSAAARRWLAFLLEILETRLSVSVTSRDDLLSRLLIASATLLFARVQSYSRDSFTRLENTTEHTTLKKAYATFFDFTTGEQVEQNYPLV